MPGIYSGGRGANAIQREYRSGRHRVGRARATSTTKGSDTVRAYLSLSGGTGGGVYGYSSIYGDGADGGSVTGGDARAERAAGNGGFVGSTATTYGGAGGTARGIGYTGGAGGVASNTTAEAIDGNGRAYVRVNQIGTAAARATRAAGGAGANSARPTR